MRGRGYEFVVIAPQSSSDQPSESEYQGIPVYRFPFWNAMVDIDLFTKIRGEVTRLKRSFAPDLVHIYAVNRSNFFYHISAHEHSAPLLVTLHGLMASQANDHMARTLGAADWVTACSSALLNAGRKMVPQITSRSSTIHNGIDEPRVQPTPLSFDPPQLLCLGRLVKEKGVDVMLDAFPSVLTHYPNTRLVIGGDGPEMPYLEQQALRLGVRDAVDFMGWVAPDKVAELMNTSSVVIMPSRGEAHPLVSLEAAMMNRPIVATRVGGLPEVVTDQETGILIGSDDSNALSEAIVFLLDQPEIATHMGQEARRRARKEFSWEGHVDAYDTLYQRMVRDYSNRN
jgi:glycogen(starch) synthase